MPIDHDSLICRRLIARRGTTPDLVLRGSLRPRHSNPKITNHHATGAFQMKSTYKAVEVSAPNILKVVERPIPEPGPGQVRIRVEACGICHTDAATVTGTYPGLKLPRVPGHEVVGRIEALGAGVAKWKIGQRVGIGFFGGEDGTCEPCRRGDIVNCLNAVIPGVTIDGGYAEVMIAEACGISY